MKKKSNNYSKKVQSNKLKSINLIDNQNKAKKIMPNFYSKLKSIVKSLSKKFLIKINNQLLINKKYKN